MTYSFLSYKALGDLVIAVTSIEAVVVEQRDRIKLVYGAHLADLVSAIAPQMHTEALSFGERDVPALFDIKKKGVVRALRSAFGMRRALQDRATDGEDLLILDQAGPRQRVITYGSNWQALPSAANIYHSYAQLLTNFGFDRETPAVREVISAKSVGIFAGSRIADKNLPGAVIDSIEGAAAAVSLVPTLFLLEGERRDLETSGRERTMIPRSFPNLLSAIDSVDLVISTDSLPAHLAERIGKPVFVVSPRPNPYWLPRSSYQCEHHALFSDIGGNPRLLDFLRQSA